MKTSSTPFMAVSAMLAGLSHSFEMRRPPPVELVKGFDWADPFTPNVMATFQSRCDEKKQFEVFEYTLAELMEPPPKGLKPWAKGLKAVFADREYPGGWLGLDRHAGGRSVLLMNYDQIPLLVRQWIEQQERADGEGKALFAVLEKPKNDEDEIEKVVEFPEADKVDRANDKDKVAVFAPGALYGILPLWTAEASECKGRIRYIHIFLVQKLTIKLQINLSTCPSIARSPWMAGSSLGSSVQSDNRIIRQRLISESRHSRRKLPRADKSKGRRRQRRGKSCKPYVSIIFPKYVPSTQVAPRCIGLLFSVLYT